MLNFVTKLALIIQRRVTFRLLVVTNSSLVFIPVLFFNIGYYWDFVLRLCVCVALRT